MILGPISYLDCLVFVLFLAPQLLLDVGVIGTIKVAVQVLPFLRTEAPLDPPPSPGFVPMREHQANLPNSLSPRTTRHLHPGALPRPP